MRNALILIFVALALVIGVFVVPLGDSADSAHSYLGGCLMWQSHREIYVDYKSQHNPLLDDMMAVLYRIEGKCDTTSPRYIFFAAFVGVLLLYALYTKPFVPVLLLASYGFLAPRYDFQLALAETLAMEAGLITVLLLWRHTRMKRLTFWLLFGASQFIFLTANPLYIPVAVVLVVYFLRETQYAKSTLLFVSVVPAILYFLHIHWKEYVDSVFLFNATYYPQCTGSAREILGRYFSPLKHFSREGVERLVFEIGIGLWAGAAGVVSKRKTGIYTFVIALLLAIRPEGFHLGPFVMYALAVIYFLTPERFFVLFAFLTALMADISLPVYQIVLGDNNPDLQTYEKLVRRYSNAGDNVLLYPGKPEAYIATNRTPGSYYAEFGPCLEPDAEYRVIRDIDKNKVSMILVDNKHNAFGKGTPAELLSKVIQFLQTSGRYVTIPIDTFITVYKRTL